MLYKLKAVLERVKMFAYDNKIQCLKFVANLHIMSLLLPRTINVTFSDNEGKYFMKWENVIVDSCSSIKPMLRLHTSKSRNMFQESRLVVNSKQLRFVSCHKERIHWTSQLKELISPFDTPTWFLTLIICFVL